MELGENELKFNLYGNFHYLDTIERRNFLSNTQQYYIEQVQTQSELLDTSKLEHTIPLNFKHQVKEILWVFENENGTYNSEIMENASISMNNYLRTEKLGANIYNSVQAFMHHTNAKDHIYSYSFSLNPENIQPSGSTNFNKIENVSLDFLLNKNALNKKITLKIFAINHNLLRISE